MRHVGAVWRPWAHVKARGGGQRGHTRSVGTRWHESEWAALFAAYPPEHDLRPGWEALRGLAIRVHHSPDAILAVWEDAERYRRGAAYGEASPGLRRYLDVHR